jgi:molybdenum cofactor cytidylyltransferase
MGRAKALLPDRDGVPFVVRSARALIDGGAAKVCVVARPDTQAAITSALAELSTQRAVSVLVNADPDRGQLSSLLTGLDAAPEADALLVTLVDVPFVSVATVRAVTAAWEQTRAPIVRPARGDEHGHPVLFDRSTFEALSRAPLADGAKPVVRGYAAAIVNVPVDDDGAFVDLDTPDDYRGALTR